MAENNERELEIEITEADLQPVDSKKEWLVIDESDLVPSTGGGQSTFEWAKGPPQATKAAVDIVLLVDTSGSMNAADYKPNRLEAAKAAARLFTRRKVLQGYQDRVALIGFGGSASLLCPLTADMDQVTQAIDSLRITHSGTMIGIALKAAYDELAKQKSPRQGIVLLSDGGDEYDTSNPVTVASRSKGVKLFTIGMGTTKGGMAQLPHGKQLVHLNEKLLKQLAKVAGGSYLYAPDVQQLQQAYLSLADY